MPKRIGDVAKAAGVGVETVRFYEREGLIDQPPKPMRGWREYDEAILAQLDQVRLAKTFGLTLQDIKRIKARARGGRPGFCAVVRDTVSARLVAIENEITDLQQKRAALQEWRRLCEARGDAADCPLYTRIAAVMPATPARKRK